MSMAAVAQVVQEGMKLRVPLQFPAKALLPLELSIVDTFERGQKTRASAIVHEWGKLLRRTAAMFISYCYRYFFFSP